jgi:nucleoside-diphosphate-sugar epimerase
MQLEGSRIAVTGATGFLGRYICSELQSRGAKVIGVVRRPDRVPELLEQGVEMRKADLAEPEALRRGFEGVDAVVSNAALFDLSNSNWQAHERANVAGGVNVAEAAAAAGVKRFLLVSSCAVYADQGKGNPCEEGEQFTETSKRKRMARYPISKALAEQAAWEVARSKGFDMSAIRPSAIYGAHDPNFTPVLLKLARKPLSFPFVRVPMVYAGDVAKAIAASLEKDETVGKSYNTSGPDVGLNPFLEALREAYNLTVPFRIPVPMPLTIRYDSSRGTNEIGFHQRSFLEGLADTIRIESQSPQP